MNTKAQPLVSIVIPVYNQRPDFLRQCIDSVVAQTYSNIEIIVSDNHSTNETPEVLNSYKDNRLKIVKPPKHLPITPNFQWGSEQATGEYITFLPSDDWLEKECIEELVNLIQPHPNVVMAYCSVRQYYDGIKAHFINLKPGISKSEDEIAAYVTMTKPKGWLVGGLFRKSVYDKIGGIGSGELIFTSDRWLFIQMAMHGDGAYTEKPYGIFRNDNPARKSRTLEYSRDVVNVFRLIEEKGLMRMPSEKRIVEKEKNKMAFNFIREIPAHVRAGNISGEALEEILENLKKLSTSRFIHVMASLYSKKGMILPISILFYFENKYRNAKSKIRNLFVK